MIKNIQQLATSPLRKQGLQIAEAGFAAINTAAAVRKSFIFDAKKNKLKVLKQEFNLLKFKKIIVVGFGKAALEAVTEIQKILQNKITCGFVIDLKEGDLGNIVCRVGTHPRPTIVNVEATRELVAMLETCDKDDLVVAVVSGGGSALLCDPHDMSCEVEASIISALTVKGADIREINTVRKHISKVKGGQLSKIIYPATCVSLIFSDVPGDDLSMVASGPTVLDGTTTRDAELILKKYDALAMCGLSSCRLLETPKEHKYFEKVHNILVVSARQLLEACREEAENLGWKVKIYSTQYQGEAKNLGPQMASSVGPKQCLLAAGESTVKITGKGKGGRNQEMALSALSGLAENQVLLCLASDGHDNTEAAGAIADTQTLARSRILNLKSDVYLANNDSFTFFEAVGDQVLTGLTGANVSDFVICLRG